MDALVEVLNGYFWWYLAGFFAFSAMFAVLMIYHKKMRMPKIKRELNEDATAADMRAATDLARAKDTTVVSSVQNDPFEGICIPQKKIRKQK